METGDGQQLVVLMLLLISEFLIRMNLQKFDADLLYINKWIMNFAPDYLPEIVEHDFARKRALEVYKNSLLEKF